MRNARAPRRGGRWRITCVYAPMPIRGTVVEAGQGWIGDFCRKHNNTVRAEGSGEASGSGRGRGKPQLPASLHCTLGSGWLAAGLDYRQTGRSSELGEQGT